MDTNVEIQTVRSIHILGKPRTTIVKHVTTDGTATVVVVITVNYQMMNVNVMIADVVFARLGRVIVANAEAVA